MSQFPFPSEGITTTTTTTTTGGGDNSGGNNGRTIKVVAGYGLHQRLGAGSFATVYKGIKVSPQTPGSDIVAIKAISRNNKAMTKKVLQNLEIEISILQTYRHRNIVCLQDVQKTERHFYLILEYCGGGDLQQLIRTRKTGRLTERLTRRLMRDLSAGLKFLWRQELVHRDIKPQNLLLTGALPLDELYDPERTEQMEAERRQVNCPTDQFCLKLADFGFARHLQTASLAETLCGSPLYMAPEILQHQRYDAKADLWSVGTVLFEMISGRPPFNGENHIDLLRNIQRKAVRLPPEVRVSKPCVNLLRLLLNRNPLSRAGFKEFFEACDVFVALGCEGVPTNDPGACRRRSSNNLGSIPEDAAASATSADSMMTVQTTTHHGQSNAAPVGQYSPQSQQQDMSPSPFVSVHSQMQTVPTTGKPSPQQVSFVSTPPLKPTIPRQYPTLQPLEPSPPVTRPQYVIQQPTGSSMMPQLPALNSQQQQAGAGASAGQQPKGSHVVQFQQQQQSSHVTWQPHPSQSRNVEMAQLGGGNQRSNSSSLQNSGDDFVLVEHSSSTGISSATNAIVPASSALASQENNSYQRQSSRDPSTSTTSPVPRYYVNASGAPSTPIGIATGRGEYYNRGCSTSNSNQQHRIAKGMLGTSPNTGGQLLGMLQGRLISYSSTSNQNSTPSSSPPPQATTPDSAKQANASWENQMGLVSKLLATAEDVGRRAVSVAHLGDARAYLALRLSLMDEGSSVFSVTSMEGVVEEDEGEDEENGATSDDTNSTEIMTSRRRPRSVSADKDMTEASKRVVEEGDEEEVEEMPFACVSQEYASSMPSGMLSGRSQLAAGGKSPSTNARAKKHVIKPTRAIVQAHFKEALSCYLKALQMLKGSITAGQKVEKDLATIMSQQQYLSVEQRNRGVALQRQSPVTASWLAGQFKGVLERADAANVEVGKLEPSAQSQLSSTTGHEQHGQSSQTEESHPVTQVEELIYNHSLACGREGAVKQLLGQFEAARSSYRTAGLLAETLLMESTIGKEDREILEGYVDGFSARITEIDTAVLQQSRMATTTSSTNSSSVAGGSIIGFRRSSGTGIAGLLGQPATPPFAPQQSPPFATNMNSLSLDAK